MNLNNFTTKSQEAVQQAQQIAMTESHQSIENGHILKGILNVDENVTPFLLKKLNVNISSFTKALDRIVQSYAKVSGGEQYLSQSANKALTKASTYLKEFGDEFVREDAHVAGVGCWAGHFAAHELSEIFDVLNVRHGQRKFAAGH